MAGEKAKENKKLTASCVGCSKEMSVELLVGFVVGRAPRRRIVAVCQACREKGWDPASAEAGAPASEMAGREGTESPSS